MNTLRKPEILRGEHSFRNVLIGGKAIQKTYLRAVVTSVSLPCRTPEPVLKVGFTTQRGTLTAAERNRMKRLMRESYRLNKSILLSRLKTVPMKTELVFIFSPKSEVSVDSISFACIEEDLKSILSTIATRSFN